jgi:CO dehydrogenase maturation factor
MLARDEWVIVDCEAGLEHLGRATAQGVDALLIVIEPDRVGAETARRIRKLAGEIGLRRLYAVGNKVRGPEDAEFIQQNLDDIELLTLLPDSPAARDAARSGTPIQDSELKAQARAILQTLQAG